MDEHEKPQAGEWWESKHWRRVFVIGQTCDGKIVVEFWNFNLRIITDVEFETCGEWRRLDGCDSFEWVESPDWVSLTDPEHELRACDWVRRKKDTEWKPSVWHDYGVKIKDLTGLRWEFRCLRKDVPAVVPAPDTYPQWWTTIDGPDSPIAFVRRDSATEMTIVRKDGIKSTGFTWSTACGKRTRLTEAEALALLDPPATETFPQWIIRVGNRFKDAAYLLRGSQDFTCRVLPDGKTEMMLWDEHCESCVQYGDWKRCTQAEAQALLDPLPTKALTITVTRWLCSDDGETWVKVFNSVAPTAWKTAIPHGTETYEVPL